MLNTLIFTIFATSLIGAIGYAYFVYIKPSHPTWVSVVVGCTLVLVSNSLVTYILLVSGAGMFCILASPWVMFAVWGSPMIAIQQYKHYTLQLRFDHTMQKLNGHAKPNSPFQEVEE